MKETHTIDATNKVLGRLAVEIALLLRGKYDPDFVPYKDGTDLVVVKNAGKIKFTGKKTENKKYYRHTGYLGGIKETPLRKFLEKDPAIVLRKAVFGMLPKNKLRSRQIKRLLIEK